MSTPLQTRDRRRSLLETCITGLVIVAGVNFFGYLPAAILTYKIYEMPIDEGLMAVLCILLHLCFLIAMLLYAWAVRKDREYILSFARGKPSRNLLFALCGAAFGALLMGISLFAAAAHGDLVFRRSPEIDVPMMLFALFAIICQATTEEVMCRGFLFGKLRGEGVPLVWAIAVNAFFFVFLHLPNLGMGIIPVLQLIVVSVQYSLCCHYFGNIWFVCGVHIAWNYMQEFLFGLPNSGEAAPFSLFTATVNGSSFFYDEVFGIEGGAMAVLVDLLGTVAIVLIGRAYRRRAEQKRSRETADAAN